MKQLLIIPILLFVSITTSAIDLEKKAQEIRAEAMKIYYSERASWLGTDIMMEVYNRQPPSNMQAYFSYQMDSVVRCVFYSKDSIPKILITIEFDTSFTKEKTTVADFTREFTQKERDYYDLRQKMNDDLLSTKGFYEYYEKTNFNIIPIIDEISRRVYILTGTTEPGIVLFGNDYLIEFDKNNKITKRKKIHRNLIQIPTDETKDSQMGAMHTHLPETGDFISPTDICTLMLYAPYTNWTMHSVVSENYMSIWSCTNRSLVFISTKTLKKINKSEEQRKKK